MEKKYLQYMLGSTLIWLLGIMILNFLIDPGAIYHRQKNFSVVDFSKMLLHSHYGLWWPEGSFNEREIKKELILHSNSDCVVIGSSHVMQIGNQNNNLILHRLCKSIMNLGVSGASIEDHFIYAFLATQNKHIKKIILGIDPWTFAYNKDMRYDILHQEYSTAKSMVLGAPVLHETTKYSDAFLNLINLEYTLRSLQKLKNINKNAKKPFQYQPSMPVDMAHGGQYPLLLPDGSLIYSAKFISESFNNQHKINDVVYKTDGEINEPQAIKDYKTLLSWIKNRHIEPVLLMTPYHEISWKNKEQSNYQAIQKTTKVIERLAGDLHLKMIGTYAPFQAKCTHSEFYDFMHPTIDCVNKISLTYVG
jgi:hypothetical protein